MSPEKVCVYTKKCVHHTQKKSANLSHGSPLAKNSFGMLQNIQGKAAVAAESPYINKSAFRSPKKSLTTNFICYL